MVDHRTFIDDYLMTVEFIDWLKDFKKEMEENRFELLWGTRADYED